jgi:hypothetical protein
MDSYYAVRSQDDMDRLLASIAGFHDSLTKEIHLVNRAFVRGSDKSMVMPARLDAQALIQSQWEPFAMELLFIGIRELHLSGAAEYWGASGVVEVVTSPVETKRVKLAFDSELKIASDYLFYRVREGWLGPRSFLRSEVPSFDAVPATVLQDRWRQCSSCLDAWEEQLTEVFSHCPQCGQLTELRNC